MKSATLALASIVLMLCGLFGVLALSWIDRQARRMRGAPPKPLRIF